MINSITAKKIYGRHPTYFKYSTEGAISQFKHFTQQNKLLFVFTNGKKNTHTHIPIAPCIYQKRISLYFHKRFVTSLNWLYQERLKTLFSRRLILSPSTFESNYDYLIMALSLNYSHEGEDSIDNCCTSLWSVQNTSLLSLTNYDHPNCLVATVTKFLLLPSPSNIYNNLPLI